MGIIKGKVFLSTIALSLLLSFGVWGQSIKGQPASLMDWEQDPEESLDIKKWMLQSQIESETPDWLVRLRHSRQLEMVGKILSCSGSCQILRGTSSVQGQYLSQLVEGDELVNAEDSTAWVYLMDGSLLRLAAKTTVTFQEINFSKDEVLIYLKLLEGHVHYLPRTKVEEKVDLGPQTDAHSLPLMLEVANEAHFEREIFQGQTEAGHLSEYLFYGKHSKNHQFKFLNELRKKNNEGSLIKTTLLMAAPNMTVTSQGSAFDMMYLLGGKGYIKKRGEGHLDLSLRGYTRLTSYTITDDQWLEVIENGRGFDQVETVSKDLQLLELLTKRIVSFKVAQEVWYESFTKPILASLDSGKKMAENFGYFLWDERLAERRTFLEEYIRRLETTHLQSLSNLISKMENRGEVIAKTPTNVYYKKALDSYIWSLKTQYSFDKMQIRETNNLQYYVWILKNVKAKKL
ncbi:MAG TPA: hypothetical protein VKY27_05615 [Bacteriovoracaceae bacterium]|nr:hypothetical protein [Bacteriovoracaceae bacterium]